MRPTAPILALAAALAVSAPATAATLTYDGLFAFGDSLTDSGNAYDASFGTIPESPPYHRGRFSNGPVWYDHVARAFRREGLETRNYAFGGAHARPNGDGIPDIDEQRRVFRLRADPGPDALASVWIGGNDLLEKIGNPGVRRLSRKAAEEAIGAANSLRRGGIDTVLLFNLPSFRDIPRFANSRPAKRAAAARASKTYNAVLRHGARDLRDKGMTVIEVDVAGLYRDLFRNPGDYGLDDVRNPCLVNDRVVCNSREQRRSAFWDDIHPSAALHEIVGAHVLDLIGAGGGDAGLRTLSAARAPAGAAPAPVPLPAPGLLLIAGLAAIGLVSGRRRRGR
jgi:phospholipase/lecithinase/hemolysin